MKIKIILKYIIVKILWLKFSQTPMERWQNKIAVVTGASAGIGAACVRALLAKGMIVVGLARSQVYMENEFKASLPVDQRVNFYAMKCDLCIADDIRKVFAWVAYHLGGLHLLVNNAGILEHRGNNTIDSKICHDVNLFGVTLCTREAFHLMKRLSIDGHIILINSIIGASKASITDLNWNLYRIKKQAVTAMIEVLRQEFLQHQTKIKFTGVTTEQYPSKALDVQNTLSKEVELLQCKEFAAAVLYCIQMPTKVQIREIFVNQF